MDFTGDASNLPNVLSTPFGPGGQAEEEPYTIEPANWFKSQPYGFVFNSRSAISDAPSTNSFTMYLPILPQNIQVVTHFATNVITTLYGVIEEHSEVRYYDIVISGNTGIAPRYVNERSGDSDGDKTAVISNGRSAFQDGALKGLLGGFLPEVTNTISQAANLISDIGNSLSGGPSNDTGVSPDATGYVAFHKLYRYFLKYKKDAAGVGQSGIKQRSTHPLQFVNYKDNIKYDCSPTSFTLTRSAEQPMLYNYQIKLRAYNLRNVSDKAIEINALDKFGLGGISGQSLFSSLSGAAGSAATLVSAVF